MSWIERWGEGEGRESEGEFTDWPIGVFIVRHTKIQPKFDIFLFSHFPEFSFFLLANFVELE